MGSSFAHITTPNQRNPPRGNWFKQVSRSNNSSRVTGGPGVLVTQTPSGTTVSIKPGASGAKKQGWTRGDGVPCKIISGSTLAGYAVQVYSNGPSENYTATGMLFLLECAGMSDLPIGAWTLGFVYDTLSITGGNE